MYTILTQREIEVLLAAAAGLKFAQIGKDAHKILDSAGHKFRFGTDLKNGLLEGECDYSREWFKSHPIGTKELIDRYQNACKAADRAFWAVRKGIGITTISEIRKSENKNANDDVDLPNIPRSIYDLDIPRSVARRLEHYNDICTVADLVTKTKRQMRTYRNFGNRSLALVEIALQKEGLFIGMNLKGIASQKEESEECREILKRVYRPPLDPPEEL